MRRMIRVLVALVLVGAFATTAFAFTQGFSGDVPSTTASAGNSTIGLYTVSSFAYNLNSLDPSTIESVTVTLDAAASQVFARVDASGSWSSQCTGTGPYTCVFSGGVNVADADQLDIVATSN